MDYFTYTGAAMMEEDKKSDMKQEQRSPSPQQCSITLASNRTTIVQARETKDGSRIVMKKSTPSHHSQSVTSWFWLMRQLLIWSGLPRHRNIMALERLEYGEDMEQKLTDEEQKWYPLLPALVTKHAPFTLYDWCVGNVKDYRVFNPRRDAAVVTYQCLTALKILHEAGVIHRDVKPSNIVCIPSHKDADATPLILFIDFEHSVVGQNAGGPDFSDTIGSFGYQAPEILHAYLHVQCFKGDAAKMPVAEPVSDVWSVGMILVIMLLGNISDEIQWSMPSRALAHVYSWVEAPVDLAHSVLTSQLKQDLAMYYSGEELQQLLDLLPLLLSMHSYQRLSARMAMEHDYFTKTHKADIDAFLKRSYENSTPLIQASSAWTESPKRLTPLQKSSSMQSWPFPVLQDPQRVGFRDRVLHEIMRIMPLPAPPEALDAGEEILDFGAMIYHLAACMYLHDRIFARSEHKYDETVIATVLSRSVLCLYQTHGSMISSTDIKNLFVDPTLQNCTRMFLMQLQKRHCNAVRGPVMQKIWHQEEGLEKQQNLFLLVNFACLVDTKFQSIRRPDHMIIKACSRWLCPPDSGSASSSLSQQTTSACSAVLAAVESAVRSIQTQSKTYTTWGPWLQLLVEDAWNEWPKTRPMTDPLRQAIRRGNPLCDMDDKVDCDVEEAEAGEEYII